MTTIQIVLMTILIVITNLFTYALGISRGITVGIKRTIEMVQKTLME